jgi:gas vesicle protein
MRQLIMAGVVLGAIATQAHAQDTGEKKPGGLNKIAHNVSKTAKKAGRDTKAEVKRESSGAHRALTANGNEVKEKAKAATGVTSKSPDATHKPGGLNKAARDVSHASKETGADVKHAVKKAGSDTHKELTKTGKDAKEAVKKP